MQKASFSIRNFGLAGLPFTAASTDEVSFWTDMCLKIGTIGHKMAGKVWRRPFQTRQYAILKAKNQQDYRYFVCLITQTKFYNILLYILDVFWGVGRRRKILQLDLKINLQTGWGGQACCNAMQSQEAYWGSCPRSPKQISANVANATRRCLKASGFAPSSWHPWVEWDLYAC